MNSYPFAAVLTLFVGLTVWAQPAATPKPASRTIEEVTRGMKHMPGYFPLFWDAQRGRLLLEIDKWDTEFLYLTWLATGVGSNDVGLDRGQPGANRVVAFQRIGPRVLLVQHNYGFRAESPNAEERRAVEEAFAQSVLAGFEIEAEAAGGRVLVDATKFFVRDVHDVAGALRRARQGTFTLDPARSALYLARTKNFPRNTEVEATLTLAGDSPGPWLEQVVPHPQAVSVREHHSLVRLPEPGYKAREFDPRSGYFPLSYLDFAVPLGERLDRRLILRHRLRKKDPAAAFSEPVQPIIYYVDPGVPEPIRSALVEGARSWNDAFAAAGYKDAFQVRVLPEGADPMDVRYNVIQWVHRATRGWAYGSAMHDPRTGEIIKGHVNMDSQRARQDYRLLEGLLADYEEGKPVSAEIERVVLARMRQLSAHEVGHALGLAHNFAASARGRASVMDYPYPVVMLKEDGSFDVSQAYASGIGAWDKVAIAYGYQDFPAGTDEKMALGNILARASADGLVFITDQDARPAQGAHPQAHLWDNGTNAADELERILKVRRRALERFSEKNIRMGAPLSTLEEELVLIYLLHRYQVEATAKLVGGLDYTYAHRGDGQKIVEPISPDEQMHALEVLLRTLQPETLALPDRVLALIPPAAYGYERTIELFTRRTGPAFDALAPAQAAANLTVKLLFDPARAARLLEQQARDPRFPGLAAVIDRIIDATWKASPQTGVAAEIRRLVNESVLDHLMALAADDKASGQVRALARFKLVGLDNWLTGQTKSKRDEAHRAHCAFAQAQLQKFLKDPSQPLPSRAPELPPGHPIGAAGRGCEWN
jgi:hypothetical protein